MPGLAGATVLACGAGRNACTGARFAIRISPVINPNCCHAMPRCTLCRLMVNRTASEKPHPALSAASTFWTKTAGQIETYVCRTCGSEWQRLAALPGIVQRHWLAIR